MNLFKIVQKRTDKSKVKNSPYRDVAAVLLFVFLLPYVISCLWGHIGEETERISDRKKEETDWIDEGYEITLSGNLGNRKMSMQEYLIRKLEIVMGKENDEGIEYEFETLKAQAVLLRTELWSIILSNKDAVTIQDDVSMYGTKSEFTESYDESGDSSSYESVYEQAVKETDGIYLAYEKSPIKAAFFPISNGHTREASEVWENAAYPYLVSVECSQDIMAQDYQSQVIVSIEEYCGILQEICGDAEMSDNELDNVYDNTEFTYDSAGYAVKAEFNGYSCSGENFRNAFGLNSASFEMEYKDNEVIFHVKGMGHGFGMSQYGANERAVSGDGFDAILKYYFFQTELAKIE